MCTCAIKYYVPNKFILMIRHLCIPTNTLEIRIRIVYIIIVA